MDGQFEIEIRSVPSGIVPLATKKRLRDAEALVESLVQFLSTPLSRPSHRAVWTLLDKILNKALDYDVRILHLEIISLCATRFDQAVRRCS